MPQKYYVHSNWCHVCRRYDRMCIGEAVEDWKFLFHTDEEHPDAAAWIIEFINGKAIYNEGDSLISLGAFIKMIIRMREGKTLFDNVNSWFMYREREKDEYLGYLLSQVLPKKFSGEEK